MYTYLFCKKLLYKQGSTRRDKNLSNSSGGLRNAKRFEKISSDPIGFENRAAAIDSKVTV